MSDAFDEAHRSPRRSTARCQITDNRKVRDPTSVGQMPSADAGENKTHQ